MGARDLFRRPRFWQPPRAPRHRAHSERDAPKTARATIRVVLLAAVLGVVWAHSTELPEIAYASGSIQPTGALRRVEHLDGGVVDAIHIREGQAVAEGQRPVNLAEIDTNAELERLQVRKDVLEMALHRNQTNSEAIGADPLEEPAPIQGGARALQQLRSYEARRRRLAERVVFAATAIDIAAQIRANIEEKQQIYSQERRRIERLVATGTRSNTALEEWAVRYNELQATLLQARGAQIDAGSIHVEAIKALGELHETTLDTLLSDIEASQEELSLIERAIADNRSRHARLTIASPIGGVVQALYLNSKDEVIEPGGLVAEILPTSERLIAELRLKPSDIGHVDPGDPVEIRLTTFNTKRYGLLHGRVAQISATSTENEQSETFFLVRVDLADQIIGTGLDFRPLKAGMEVNASIVTGTRSVLEYLAEPILGPFRTAFGER